MTWRGVTGWVGGRVGGVVWARLIGQKINGNCREWARMSRVSCLVCYSASLTVMPTSSFYVN